MIERGRYYTDEKGEGVLRQFFICGASTQLENGYPKNIWICPEYGSNQMIEYVPVKKKGK